jgi:phosphatidylserine/phosphatidylglycerophosphate/cardiolipin synthase-like enzyme
MNRKRHFSFVCGTLLAAQLVSAPGSAQTVLPFVEPDDGRAPLTSELDQATQSIDIYVFILTLAANDEILNSLRSAVDRGVIVRALLEPCPGESSTCVPPNPDAYNACLVLTQAGISVKWANPAFPKTHAKTTLLDNSRALVITVNLERSTFTVRRDYGVLTDEPAVVENLARIFAQDWQSDDPISDCSLTPDRISDATVQDYSTLSVTPDNGRQFLVGTVSAPGLIRSAQQTLQVQMEKIDPQENRGVIPALRDVVQRGAHVQVLLKDDAAGVDAALRVVDAGGEARCQANLHAKMIIVDGERVYLGSQNLTRDSLDLRREIGWVTTDPATLGRFANTFDSDWAAARICSP